MVLIPFTSRWLNCGHISAYHNELNHVTNYMTEVYFEILLLDFFLINLLSFFKNRSRIFRIFRRVGLAN